MLKDAPVNVEEAEATAADANFREVLARLAHDEQAWVKHRTATSARTSSLHILDVLHTKAQNAIGLNMAHGYCEQHCLMLQMPDMLKLGSVPENFVRKIGGDGLTHVVWMDMSKLGIMAQPDINKCAGYCAWAL